MAGVKSYLLFSNKPALEHPLLQEVCDRVNSADPCYGDPPAASAAFKDHKKTINACLKIGDCVSTYDNTTDPIVLEDYVYDLADALDEAADLICAKKNSADYKNLFNCLLNASANFTRAETCIDKFETVSI